MKKMGRRITAVVCAMVVVGLLCLAVGGNSHWRVAPAAQEGNAISHAQADASAFAAPQSGDASSAARMEMDSNRPSIVLAVGERVSLPAKILTREGELYEGEIHCESSDSSVVDVDSASLLGRSPGSTLVTVYAGEMTGEFEATVVRYADLYDIEVFAHRGLGSGAPENSLEGIRAAVSTGAVGVEIDVRRTRDGVLVLSHDELINRTSDGMGRVADMTYEQLMGLDFHGTEICTLEQALQAIRETGMQILIEFKESSVVKDTVAMVQRYGLEEQAVYISFDLEQLKAALSVDPEAKTAFLYNKGSLSDWAIQVAAENGVWVLIPKHTILTESLAAKIHAAGLRVGVYTVNTKAQFRKVYRMGLDWLITDYPSEMSNMLQ